MIKQLLTHDRYSCRSYSDRIPTAGQIREVLETAHMAPSACNRQPWRLMVIGPDDEEGRQAVAAAYNRPWILSAPYYVIVCGVADEAWVRPFDNKCHVDVDVAILTEHICLAASEAGLATCWVCNFDPAELTSKIEFPQGVDPVVILPTGYPATTDIPEKKRKELDDILI
ncbi:MAG: nitroreductase family protein [Muribaculaceae bacterium]|nr:nitroreductase family protein [Muribaculaceae bacterium]